LNVKGSVPDLTISDTRTAAQLILIKLSFVAMAAPKDVKFRMMPSGEAAVGIGKLSGQNM
jgi:hypothetical protein